MQLHASTRKLGRDFLRLLLFLSFVSALLLVLFR